MTEAEVDQLAKRFLTEQRLQRFDQVASSRLRGLTVLCENIADIRNLSACVRSAEVMGVTRVHATMNARGGKSLRRNAASGACRWVEVVWHETTEAAIDALHRDQYALIGTAVADRAVPYANVALPDRVALCMGPEFSCMSTVLQEACETIVHIPMHGFTESLNLSVAMSIILERFSNELRARDNSRLLETEKQALVRSWCRDDLVRKFQDRLPDVIERYRRDGAISSP